LNIQLDRAGNTVFRDIKFLAAGPASERIRSTAQSRRNSMKRVAMIFVALVSGLAGTVALADDVTLESVPPVVIKTVPEAGTSEVDPKLTEIKVTFSKHMQDDTWSWSTLSKESFPKLDGKPKYLADKRTCVLPVKLEPGKTYAIWVNTEKFGNFKDTDGRSAVPYLLVFKTKK
jgi:hypothetical protein